MNFACCFAAKVSRAHPLPPATMASHACRIDATSPINKRKQLQHLKNVSSLYVAVVSNCFQTCLSIVGSNLIIFKLEKTTPNMSQHDATGWLNARNMLRPTMLRYVAFSCCDRLAGASSLNIVKFEPTTRNMSQHGATGRPNGRNMLRTTMLRCCVDMLRSFGRGFKFENGQI